MPRLNIAAAANFETEIGELDRPAFRSPEKKNSSQQEHEIGKPYPAPGESRPCRANDTPIKESE